MRALGWGGVGSNRPLAADSADLDRYYARLAEASPDSSLERFPHEDARLAYWINAYNAAAMTAVLTHYPTPPPASPPAHALTRRRHPHMMLIRQVEGLGLPALLAPERSPLQPRISGQSQARVFQDRRPPGGRTSSRPSM